MADNELEEEIKRIEKARNLIADSFDTSEVSYYEGITAMMNLIAGIALTVNFPIEKVQRAQKEVYEELKKDEIAKKENEVEDE